MLASQFEQLLGNNAKYLELEQNAISNPLYCADNDQELPHIETELNEDSLEHLWYPPNRDSIELATAELDNIQGFNNQTSKLLECQFTGSQMGYDVPRPLIETKTIEQKLRYENELLASLTKSKNVPNNFKNPYINDPIGQKRGSTDANDVLDYEIPKNSKCYVVMNKNIDSPNSTSYYKTVKKNNKHINDNLDSKCADKNPSKDFALKFGDLLSRSEASNPTIED